MADVLHKTATPTDYRRSVNTPDFDPASWFINPDISAVVGVPAKYWKRPLTDPVTEMTNPEKRAVDDAEADATRTSERSEAKTLIDPADSQSHTRVLVAILRLLVDEINTLRALHSLPPRNLGQLRNALESDIDAN